MPLNDDERMKSAVDHWKLMLELADMPTRCADYGPDGGDIWASGISLHMDENGMIWRGRPLVDRSIFSRLEQAW